MAFCRELLSLIWAALINLDILYFLASKTLKVLCQFTAEREVSSIEPLNLLDRDPCVLSEIEEVDLAFREHNAHTDGCTT